jgi:hypothetical protein
MKHIIQNSRPFTLFLHPASPRSDISYIGREERERERERENAGNGEFIIGCSQMEHSKSLCGCTKEYESKAKSKVNPVTGRGGL